MAKARGIRLIRRVKIGGQCYSVKVKKDLVDEKGEECLGLIDFTDTTIYLNSGQSEESLHKTLWHEIMHAICKTVGVRETERIIDGLADMMRQVLRDNKRLRDL